MSVLKIKDQNGNWQDIPAIKGADGAIQYRAGTNIQINNNTISTSGLNQTQVQDLIDASIEALGELGFTPTVVEELPSEDIDTHTIYLVPKQDSEQEDAYDEWLYINNAWEHIGSTAIDLSNYYTKSEVDDKLPMYYLSIPYFNGSPYSSITNATILEKASEIINDCWQKQKNNCMLIIEVTFGDQFSGDIRYNGVLYATSYIDLNRTKATQYNFYALRPASSFGDGKIETGYGIGIYGSWTNDVFVCSSIRAYLGKEFDFANYLAKNNTTSYTPTQQYHPATKKYVDDSISNKIWIGTQTEYDALTTYNDSTLYFIKEDTNAS